MDQPDRLIETLETLGSLLDRHKVRYARVVSDLLKGVSMASESEIKAAVRNLFRGTMGSLTDLYISKKNGHMVDDEDAANAELEALAKRLWDLSR